MNITILPMNNKTSLLHFLKPGIPKRYLLFIAALAWTFAGSILLYRGYVMMLLYPEILWTKISISVIIGIGFFILVFSKISLKHTIRIVNLKPERPCLFSFFNWQSYIMMAIMITVGITLRTSDIISPKYLSFFYIIMGTPLFLSAFRFYFFAIFYEKAENKILKK
jgi:hypothetical protein